MLRAHVLRSPKKVETLFACPLDNEQVFCYSPPVTERLFLGEAAMRKTIALRGPRCPDCAGPLVHGEGCVCCPICGFTRC